MSANQRSGSKFQSPFGEVVKETPLSILRRHAVPSAKFQSPFGEVVKETKKMIVVNYFVNVSIPFRGSGKGDKCDRPPLTILSFNPLSGKW